MINDQKNAIFCNKKIYTAKRYYALKESGYVS